MVGDFGWLFYRITDSRYLNATLSEVRSEWTFGDIVDAWRRIDFYEEEERRNQPKSPPRRF